jgi:hypothetical protein
MVKDFFFLDDDNDLFFFFFYYLAGLGPLACFSSELIWKYGSYRQSVGLLGRVIIPVARPLPTQDNINREESWTYILTSSGFEPTIAVLERAKTFRALDRAAAVIGNYNLLSLIFYMISNFYFRYF